MEKVTQSIVETEMRLRRISRIIKKNGRKILTQYPITSPQFTALQCVLEEGDLTIGELSHKIGLAFSTTTDIVDRMEKNELVKRVRDDKDRRVVRIHVLDKGKQIIEEVIHKRQQYLSDVLAVFSEEETDTLNNLLQLLHSQMQKVDARSSSS